MINARCPVFTIDVINVYNVYKKFFVNAFIILSTFMSIKITWAKRSKSIVYVHSNLRLVDKLEEISYSETTVPWFEQREFISDSDSDEDN